jgi:hypothetical protein
VYFRRAEKSEESNSNGEKSAAGGADVSQGEFAVFLLLIGV